jgi:hypothetical protein
MNHHFLAVCLCFGLTAGACATTSSKPKAKISIKPSDIDKSLAALDEKNPFLTGTHKIEIDKTGIKKYDEFLAEAAAVKGTVVVTNVVLEEIEAAMFELAGKPAGPVADYDELGAALAKNRATFTPATIARVQRDAAMLDSLVAVMKELPGRAQKVSEAGSALATQATKELTKDPFGMAAVPGVVSDGVGAVTSATADAPAALERSAKVIKVLSACACSYTSQVLTVADISPALAPSYASNPFETPEHKVDYVVTGLADYDHFFKDVAVLRGSAVLVDVLVRDVGATLASLAKAGPPTTPDEVKKMAKSLAKKAKPTGDDVTKLKNHVAQLTGIAEALTAAPARATDLMTQMKALAAATPAGVVTSPAKMAGLPMALEEAAGAIADSGAKATASLAPLKDLVGSMTSLAGP